MERWSEFRVPQYRGTRVCCRAAPAPRIPPSGSGQPPVPARPQSWPTLAHSRSQSASRRRSMSPAEQLTGRHREAGQRAARPPARRPAPCAWWRSPGPAAAGTSRPRRSIHTGSVVPVACRPTMLTGGPVRRAVGSAPTRATAVRLLGRIAGRPRDRATAARGRAELSTVADVWCRSARCVRDDAPQRVVHRLPRRDSGRRRAHAGHQPRWPARPTPRPRRCVAAADCAANATCPVWIASLAPAPSTPPR